MLRWPDITCVVIPARPYRPKDKSRVELSVLLVYRWVLARLRHQRFFSLEELNAAIRPLLNELNLRPFQRLPGSRRSVFEALDRPAMRPLPEAPYVYAEWKECTVAFDYHVDIDRPLLQRAARPRRASVWARFTAATVEVFFRSERVASHVRSYQRGASHDRARAHAQVASGTCRVVSETPDPVGRVDRHKHRRNRRAPAAL
jgi:hypothetical protein